MVFYNLLNANCYSVTPGSKSKVKSSVQRAIRTLVCTTYHLLAPHIDEVIPKKEQLDAMKMYTTLFCIRSLANPVQPRQSHALPGLRHSPLLSAYVGCAPPAPEACPSLPPVLSTHTMRPRRDSLRALRRHAHGARLDICGRQVAAGR